MMGDVRDERVKDGRVNECFAVLGWNFVVKILCRIINVVKDCCRSCCVGMGITTSYLRCARIRTVRSCQCTVVGSFREIAGDWICKGISRWCSLEIHDAMNVIGSKQPLEFSEASSLAYLRVVWRCQKVGTSVVWRSTSVSCSTP